MVAMKSQWLRFYLPQRKSVKSRALFERYLILLLVLSRSQFNMKFILFCWYSRRLFYILIEIKEYHHSFVMKVKCMYVYILCTRKNSSVTVNKKTLKTLGKRDFSFSFSIGSVGYSCTLLNMHDA